jgi:hypothetical protein
VLVAPLAVVSELPHPDDVTMLRTSPTPVIEGLFICYCLVRC